MKTTVRAVVFGIVAGFILMGPPVLVTGWWAFSVGAIDAAPPEIKHEAFLLFLVVTFAAAQGILLLYENKSGRATNMSWRIVDRLLPNGRAERE